MPPLSLFSHLRWDVVRRHVRALQPTTLLEFGCGIGGFGARFATMADYTGVEPDAISYAIARDRIEGLGGTVLNGNNRVLPEGATFDLVCAFEVLEHIEDDKGALDAWSRYVASGGHLMLSVPAWPDRFGPLDDQAGHLRRYMPGDMHDLLVGLGLTDVHIELIGWPVGYLLEAARNALARRRSVEIAQQSVEERTAASARFAHLQGGVGSVLTRAAAVPLQQLQRARPASGTCLVAYGRTAG
jgi:SAM-dependent methyltransferase